MDKALLRKQSEELTEISIPLLRSVLIKANMGVIEGAIESAAEARKTALEEVLVILESARRSFGAMPDTGPTVTSVLNEVSNHITVLVNKIRNVAPSKELWAMHIPGPDDVFPAPSREAADAHVKSFNDGLRKIRAGSADNGGIFSTMDKADFEAHCLAVVIPWPHSAKSHAAGLKNWPPA